VDNLRVDEKGALWGVGVIEESEMIRSLEDVTKAGDLL